MAKGPDDPRMRGFRARTSVEAVVRLIEERVVRLGDEPVPLREAAGRVLAESVVAGAPVPPFNRAAMDGYAVRGAETFGADPYNPIGLTIVGRSRPGAGFAGTLSSGQAVEIATGAPVPNGADAVVRVESTQRSGEVVQVVEATPPGRHVGRIGEDVAAGETVFGPGRTLRPQDLGILSALGCPTVRVTRRPRATIIVTGDELLPVGSVPTGWRIPDMNSVMLAALVARDGGTASVVGPLPDDRERIRSALAEAASSSDVVFLTGGSSTGPEDHAPSLVQELGELLVHGLALRPASPTGLGFVGSVPVLLVPGNPVSCLCAYDLLGGRIVRRLAGRPGAWPYRGEERTLAAKLTSVLGRLDYTRVRITGDGRAEPLATSGAAILSSTTRADGFVLVPPESEGFAMGETVLSWRYDP